MTKSLKQIQQDMQAAILTNDDAILKDIRDTSKENRKTLLNVYQYAYGARLSEFIAHDFPKSATYMGDDLYEEAARGYTKAFPSDNPNARWFARNFPHFLKNTAPFKDHSELGEMAELEHALNKAFDEVDAPILEESELSSLAPKDWAELSLKAHPSTTRLSHKTNASKIWTALSKDESPPEAETTEMNSELIVWRFNNLARFRPMPYDEAMIWDEAAKGATFSQLCEMLGTYWPNEDAPIKAATYLKDWLNTELLTKG